MSSAPIRRLAAVAALLGLFCTGGLARAETAASQETTYQDASFVMITLGAANQEMGIRLVPDQKDGITAPAEDGAGRQSLPNELGLDRYFYFDVHDSYIHDGKNKVMLYVTYKDIGLTPMYVEYDSYDPRLPLSKAPEQVYKRALLAPRKNSGGIETAILTLEDARFANRQNGGADFRIVTPDDLVLISVSVRLLEHQDPPPPLKIMLDGELVRFPEDEVQPFIDPQTSRTLVPVRFMVNALGISDDDIKWYGDTRTVEIRKGEKKISLTIDSDLARINDVFVKKLDQPAVIVADRTMVPLRFVLEEFDLDVDWDGATRTVILTSRSEQTADPAPPEDENQQGTQQNP